VREITLVQLYEEQREKLLFNWLVAQDADRRIELGEPTATAPMSSVTSILFTPCASR